MISFENNTWAFAAKKCCGCSVCVGICPVGALRFSRTASIFEIEIDHARCVRCRRCALFCPAGFAQESTAQSVIETAEHSQAFLTASPDQNTRIAASSGGSIRALSAQLLATDYEAVYALQVRDDGIYGNFILSVKELEKMPNSQYRPLFWGKNLRFYNPRWRKIVVIGLPCQIKAAKRFWQQTAPETEVFGISVFCRQNKDFRYEQYVANRLRLPNHFDPQKLAFRGNGWPGKASYGKQTIPYVVRPFVRQWFTIPGCHFCGDCLGLGAADLVLLDPWGIVSPAEEKEGVNLCLALTPAGRKIREIAPPSKSLCTEEAMIAVDPAAIREKFVEAAWYAGQPTTIGVGCYFSLRNWRIRLSQPMFLKWSNSRGLLLLDRIAAVAERQLKKFFLGGRMNP